MTKKWKRCTKKAVQILALEMLIGAIEARDKKGLFEKAFKMNCELIFGKFPNDKDYKRFKDELDLHYWRLRERLERLEKR